MGGPREYFTDKSSGVDFNLANGPKWPRISEIKEVLQWLMQFKDQIPLARSEPP